MNENWVIFIIGLFSGILASGFVVYEFEETRYLSLENSYKQAVVDAQNKIISQDKSSNFVNSNIGAEYEKSISDAILQYRTGGMPKTNARGVPSIPASTKPVDVTARKCAVNLQLCKIKVNDWQKWYHEQQAIYK